jgi:hypothetical protein
MPSTVKMLGTSFSDGSCRGTNGLDAEPAMVALPLSSTSHAEDGKRIALPDQ